MAEAQGQRYTSVMGQFNLFWRPEHSAEHAWTLIAEKDTLEAAEEELFYPSADLYDRALLKVVHGKQVVRFGAFVKGQVRVVDPMASYMGAGSTLELKLKPLGYDWTHGWRTLDTPAEVLWFCMLSKDEVYRGAKSNALMRGFTVAVQSVVRAATGTTRRIGAELLREGTITQQDARYISTELGAGNRILSTYYQLLLSGVVARQIIGSTSLDIQICVCDDWALLPSLTPRDQSTLRELSRRMKKEIGLTTALEDIGRVGGSEFL